MNKISVAFAVNSGYVQHLSVAIYSLLKNNTGNKVDIYVLQKDFTANNKKELRKIEKHFSDATISLIDMKEKMDLFKDISLVIDYISIETYFRFVLADLFPRLDKILYLDADILVLGDLEELWNTNIHDYYAAGVEDPYILANGYKREIGFTDNDLYVNAGVLLLNLSKIRADKMTDQLFNKLADNPKIRYQDQDILNVTFKNNIHKIDLVNNLTWDYQQNNRDKYDEAIVAHFTGPIKPWSGYGLNDRPYWFYMYDQYVDDYEREVNHKPDLRTDKFGLFTYSTENVGDDIQSIAARQFLPNIDYYIDRDFIDGQNYKDARAIKLIMNGWYTHRPDNWPPLTDKLRPLPVAMYFASEYSERVKKAILAASSKRFFETIGTVGVRDRSTEKFLQEHKIDSYFSGCLTLTIRKSPRLKKQDYILAVDIPNEVLATMSQQTKRRIITVSAELMTRGMSPSERLRIAEWFLSLVQTAHCVVTTRLHSALPSLALETPVLFMMKNNHRETNRFSGLIELTNSLSEDDYIKNPKKYNIDSPPKNTTDYVILRDTLTEKCQEYTGFTNEDGFLTSDLPFSLENYDFIQTIFNSLHEAYRYQSLHDILTSKSDHVVTEIEKYASHLKVVESEYARMEKENNELQVIKRRYDKVVRVPRAIRNRIIRRSIK